MLDLHVHALPGIDDGPRTMEDALALARALVDDGIEHIVATPHIYPGVFDNSAATIGAAFDAFQAAVSDAGIELTMTWAAEVRICPEILDWIETRRLPMLNGSLVGPSTALIELPDGQIPVGTDRLMGMMLERGITPLMAHPERNKAVMEQPTRLEALRRMGCKFQVTAGSLLGDFGTRAHGTARKLLDAGWVDVIATDAHNRSSRRPRMGAARAWLAEQYDEALALRLTKTQPTDIAGVSVFAVQTGDQRLVFRELPALAPADASLDWSVDLVLGDAAAPAPLEARPASSAAAAGEPWSLIDFRMDAVVSELESVSMRSDPFADDPAGAATPGDGQHPAVSEEDWLLPVFDIPLAPARPSARSVGAAPHPASQVVQPAWVPEAAPRVVEAALPPPSPSRPEPVVEATVSTPAVAVVVEVEALAERPVPPVPVRAAVQPPVQTPVQPGAAAPALRGLRLSDVPSRDDTADPMARGHSAPSLRTAPLAQAGRQAASMLSAVSVAPPSVRPPQLPPRPSPREREPALAPGAESVRGFRLSDLTPLPNRRR